LPTLRTILKKGEDNIMMNKETIKEFLKPNNSKVLVFLVFILSSLIFSSYVSAAALLPHRVVSHTKGEDGADFRIDMHDLHTWNASINNTGNVTLTNLEVIIGGKVIQEIPEIEVGKQKDSIILQSWEYPSDYMLYIVCDQEVKEEIKLSHIIGGSHCLETLPYILLGLILCIVGIIGGIFNRKNKKRLMLFMAIFFIGIFEICLMVILSLVCLPA